MRKYIYGMMATAVLILICAIPGETIVQIGLRKTAIDQGFALARRHWLFEATPEHEIMTAQSEPAPARKKAKR